MAQGLNIEQKIHEKMIQHNKYKMEPPNFLILDYESYNRLKDLLQSKLYFHTGRAIDGNHLKELYRNMRIAIVNYSDDETIIEVG